MAETLDFNSGHELIIVEISGQRFAIDIMSVREIRGWSASTRLPQSPDHVLGMINLRGSVLPVIDFSSRLGLGESEPNTASVVIVAEIGDRLVGLLVDAVCDILTLGEGMMQPAPDVGAPRVHEFVRGVITTHDGIVTLLTLDHVIPPGEPLAA
ncbi:chemotaxis protein CheW [Phenylobacterium sp.]|uniref:chemotaxis protein CheW n=1 Tax=Phenylobacterium sp. TaxID=1871053 RepID=UPI00122564E0|nr:chemotaxis protein CheW [Phenylobacterium sp.]THD62612.1 MAG: purine-binding chemotaxis protein CheW [Phenylobacterium sp.]